MKWRLAPGPTSRLVGPLVSTLARSWTTEVVHGATWRSLVEARAPFLFLLWHEVLLPLLWHHRDQGVAIVVSEAADGRYLASYAERLGYRCLFGSTTRGGVRALVGAAKALESGIPVAFTPDGPRGPRREMKPGILAAAERAGAAILPIHAVANRAWRLASWDRFVIPKPFAQIRIGYGEPFQVSKEAGGIAAGVDRAVLALANLEKEIEWRHGGATPIV
jgi:lysophospholipid acyltransferase (LPLAT)-like uncharacterized protein